MGFNEIAFTVITILISGIGYFLKSLHADLRNVMKEQKEIIENQGRLKGKIELVEQEARLKYQAIQEQTQLEIKNLARHVSELSDAVKEFVTKKM